MSADISASAKVRTISRNRPTSACSRCWRSQPAGSMLAWVTTVGPPRVRALEGALEDGAGHSVSSRPAPYITCMDTKTLALWAAVASGAREPVVHARLYDLLLQRRYGHGRTNAELSAVGYVELAGRWRPVAAALELLSARPRSRTRTPRTTPPDCPGRVTLKTRPVGVRSPAARGQASGLGSRFRTTMRGWVMSWTAYRGPSMP